MINNILANNKMEFIKMILKLKVVLRQKIK